MTFYYFLKDMAYSVPTLQDIYYSYDLKQSHLLNAAVRRTASAATTTGTPLTTALLHSIATSTEAARCQGYQTFCLRHSAAK
jgi:hypothetical protein